jgi:hypothetical protein
VFSVLDGDSRPSPDYSEEPALPSRDFSDGRQESWVEFGEWFRESSAPPEKSPESSDGGRERPEKTPECSGQSREYRDIPSFPQLLFPAFPPHYQSLAPNLVTFALPEAAPGKKCLRKCSP